MSSNDKDENFDYEFYDNFHEQKGDDYQITPSQRIAQSKLNDQRSRDVFQKMATNNKYQDTQSDDYNHQLINNKLNSMEMSNLKYGHTKQLNSSIFQRKPTMSKGGDNGLENGDSSVRTDDNFGQQDKSGLVSGLAHNQIQYSYREQPSAKTLGLQRAPTLGAIGKIKQKSDDTDDKESKGSDDDIQQIKEEDIDEILDDYNDDVVLDAGDGTNHENNMKNFVKMYGATLPIQSHYVLDSKLYPMNQFQCLQVIKYMAPKELDDDNVKTYHSYQITRDQCLKNNYCYDNKYNCLRLLDFSEGFMQIVQEIPIPKGQKIKLSFSPDGKYFVIFYRKMNIMQIYEIPDQNLQRLLENIEDPEVKPDKEYKTFTGSTYFQGSRTIKWSAKGDYMVIFGYERLSVINFSDDSGEKFGIIDKSRFNILQKDENGRDTKKKKYRAILDAHVSSEYLSEQEKLEQGFRCDIAVLQDNDNQIQIIRINEDEDNKKRVIPFRNDDIEGIKIAISNDFSQVVYTNGEENLILKRIITNDDTYDDEVNAQYALESLSWLSKKIIYHIIPIGTEDFLFVSSKKYDQDIDIYSSWTKKFKMAIKRKIEPNSIIISDSFMSEEHDDSDMSDDVDDYDDHGLKNKLRILSYKDDQLYYDVLFPRRHQQKIKNLIHLEGKKKKFVQKDEINQKQCVTNNENDGFCCAWPYVTFKGLKNFQYVYNINKQNVGEQSNQQGLLERFQLPYGCIRVAFAKITKTLDLFLMMEFKTEYVVYMIDLQQQRQEGLMSPEQFNQIMKPVVTYQKDEVKDTQLMDFHVRPSSDKMDISLNQKLCILVIHQHPHEEINQLYFWCNSKKSDNDEKVLDLICDTKDEVLEVLDENSFAFREDNIEENGNITFIIRQLKIEFSDYIITQMYEHQNKQEQIRSYAIDTERNNMMLVTINYYKRKQGKVLSLFDLDDNNTIYSRKLEDPELKGRIKTGLYIFNEGHIYYNNKCIKLRYDILYQDSNSGEFSENQIFDFYDYLLQLQLGEQVVKGLPVQSILNNRIVYLIKNKKKLENKRILVLPYLHERKVYLFNAKPNNEYFNTIYTRVIDDDDQEDKVKKSYLVSMNMTQSIVEVYNKQGILMYWYDYKDIKEKYGKPKAVSNSGQIFVFQKSKTLKLTIVILTLKGLYKIKEINIYDDIKKFVEDQIEQDIDTDEMNSILQSISSEGVFSNLLDPELCNIQYRINDQMDVVIQILPTRKKKIEMDIRNRKKFRKKILKNNQQLDGQISGGALTIIQKISEAGLEELQKAQNNLIYFQKGSYGELEKKNLKVYDSAMRSSVIQNCQHRGGSKQASNNKSDSQEKSFFKSKFREECQQSIFQTGNHQKDFGKGLDGIAMNNSHVFFWNKFRIWYFDTWTDKHEFHEIGLKVDKHDKNSWIKTVRTSSRNDTIVILVRQSQQSDSSIFWDVEHDGELEQFDNKVNPKVLWDSQGSPYITEEDRVYFAEMGCVSKAFDVHDINKQQNTLNLQKKEAFGFHIGYKFDEQSHSFIFFKEYISLSYCYMTFAINYKMQKLEDYNHKDYLFDQQMYNFIIDKKTFLHDKKIIKNSHYLNYILKNFKNTDLALTEQIQYYYYSDEIDADGELKRVTPLHIACELQNNKSINILLLYMSEIDYCQWRTFMDLWPQLINLKEFPQFLREQTFQNMQMQNKQSLRVDNPLNKEIIALQTSQASYVDEFYFRDKMHEDQRNSDYNSYPVKVVGLEIGWLVNEHWGQRFLSAILSSEDLDLYEIDSIVIMVEWLYSKHKSKALWLRLPAYLVSVLAFFIALYAQETFVPRHISRVRKQIVIQRELDLKQIKLKEANPEFKGQTFEPASEQVLRTRAEKAVGEDWLLLIPGFICLASSIWQIYLMRNMIKNATKTFWYSIWVYIDISYVVLNTLMAILIFVGNERVKENRQVEALLAIVITLKMFYFFALYDRMSHLIQIIFKVFRDILPFLCILLIVMFSFANAFWIIGQSQLQFDQIPKDADTSLPKYVRFWHSIQYVRFVTMGEYEVDSYVNGEQTQKSILWVLFVACTFMVNIVLISMLVAIMGDTFNHNSEIKNLVLMKSKLKFVLDNYWIQALGDDEERKKQTYLITAMFNEEDDEDVEILKEVDEQVQFTSVEMKQQIDVITTELKKVKNKLKAMENK